jgi:hypothetical protein
MASLPAQVPIYIDPLSTLADSDSERQKEGDAGVLVSDAAAHRQTAPLTHTRVRFLFRRWMRVLVLVKPLSGSSHQLSFPRRTNLPQLVARLQLHNSMRVVHNGKRIHPESEVRLRRDDELRVKLRAPLRGGMGAKDVFAAFHGRNGRITHEELVRATGQVGKTLSRSRVQYLLQKFDTAGSGTLDLSAFKALLSYLQRGRNVQDELVVGWGLVDSLKTDKVGLERQVNSANEEATSLRQRVKELEEGRADLLRRIESANEEAASLHRQVNKLEDTPTPVVGNAAAPAKVGLADLVREAQAQSRTASDAQEQHSKFAEATFTLAYTGRSTFFGGLETLIGLPTPNLRIAMETEHCASADSRDEFTTSNYGITTTPEVEWHVVLDPQAGLGILKRKEYPFETFGVTGEHMRKLQTLDDFVPALERTNASLRKLGEPTLCEEELLSGRLYTGPMVIHPPHPHLCVVPSEPSLPPYARQAHTHQHIPSHNSSKSTTSSAARPSRRRRSS